MPWDTPENLLQQEITQRRDEGCEIPEGLYARIGALDPTRDAHDRGRIDPLYDELMALPDDPALAAAEPNELDAIRALRPPGPRDLDLRLSDEEALDRLHGAWTGRAVGCALGKPLELIGIGAGRALVKRYLVNRGDWPLADYV